jgi:uncharacterized membrane protein
MQFGYHTRLKRDSERWIEKGLISSSTADEILTDAHAQKSGYSFSSVVIILGVISLCFAAMTFVAANWDEMPKIFRVTILLVGMGIAYLAAVMANAKSMPIVADAFVLLGCGVFGASIMLVGQMYHLQGRAEDAVLLWAVGSLLAAFVLRASTALWMAVALFTLWMTFEYWDTFTFAKAQINVLYLAFWLACAALAWWLRSRLSAHLLMMGLVGWIFITAVILTERHDTPIYLFGLYSLWFVIIALMITSNELGPWLRRAEATAIRYLSLVIVGMTAVWAVSISPDLFTRKSLDIFLNAHLWPMAALLVVALAILVNAMRRKSAHVYDIAFCAVWIAVAIVGLSSIGLRIPFFGEAFSLALSIWLIRMGARQDIPAVTRLGYVGFAMIMLLIYFRTAGTLLGTTGFYLTAGILMVVGAIFLPKLFRSKPANQEAA